MRFDDLTGRTFDRWTVLSRASGRLWNCRCSCGRMKQVYGDNLKSGKSRSCGCFSVELSEALFTKHGNARLGHVTPEYRAWQGMKDRCLNSNAERYSDYGGRGITVFGGWIEDFSAFLNHIGPRPGDGYSLDRIDGDGDYRPGNVRWATDVEQNRNRRNVGSVRGGDAVQVRLANGVSKSTFFRRVRKGWSKEQSATTPPRPKRPPKTPSLSLK